jgi:hypothetical protein
MYLIAGLVRGAIVNHRSPRSIYVATSLSSTISSEFKRFQFQTHEISTPDQVPNMQLLQPVLAEATVDCKALGFEKTTPHALEYRP